MVLNEETKKWASELKNILICDPSMKYISQKKWSWVTNFQKQLSHSCEGSGLKPVGNHVHQGQFTSGMERPLLTATFHCDSCNFEEKVVLKSNGIIELQSQSKGCGPTPLEAVTGVTDTSNTVLNWKTSKKEKNFYTVSVDIQPILDRENPLKYLDDVEKIKHFTKKFPKVSVKQLQDEHEQKNENTQKMARGRLFAERKEPWINDLEDLKEEIKRISGCEISMRTHNATKVLFSNLKPNDRLVTATLDCRHKPKPKEIKENVKGCGVEAITVDIFYNKKVEIKYEPEEKTDDVEFTVNHIKRKGVNPR